MADPVMLITACHLLTVAFEWSAMNLISPGMKRNLISEDKGAEK